MINVMINHVKLQVQRLYRKKIVKHIFLTINVQLKKVVVVH